jgi:UDP-glucose 4-epimerase
LASTFPTVEGHHPYGNRTLYGTAKVFNEGLLRSFNEMYGLPYVALRYFNVYGPRMDSHGAYTEVLIRWLERIAGGEPPMIYGDGSQTMDFIHVTDVARANLLAAESDASDAVFNIASGIETSLLDLAHALLRAAGSTMTPVHGPERLVNGVHRRQASLEAAQRVLGFVPQVSLDEGLRGLTQWWRTQTVAEAVTT